MSLDIDLLATGQTYDVKTVLDIAAKMKRMGNLEELTEMVERFVPTLTFDDRIMIERFYRQRTRANWESLSLKKYLMDHRNTFDPKTQQGRLSGLLVSKINNLVRHSHVQQYVVGGPSTTDHMTFAYKRKDYHLRTTTLRMNMVQLKSIHIAENEIRWADLHGDHRIYMHYDWMYQYQKGQLTRLARLFSSEYIPFPSRLIRRLLDA